MSESYPYRAIAERYELDYGTVLSYADWLAKFEDHREEEFTYWEQKAWADVVYELSAPFKVRQLDEEILPILAKYGKIPEMLRTENPE